MNYMKQIAEILGVEMGEEFKIRFESGIVPDDLYMLTDNAIYMPNVTFSSENLLWRLLTGRCEIVKLPWRPKQNASVWSVTPGGALSQGSFSFRFSYDLALYKLGKLYRTREEAEAHAEEDKAYWNEIRKELEE